MSIMDLRAKVAAGRIFNKCLKIGADMKDYHIADCICQKSVVPQQFSLFHRALKC
jgi:hypothetical protein